jgi:hypothetical protein
MWKSWKEYYLFICWCCCCYYFHASFYVFESIWLEPTLGNEFPVIAPPFHPPQKDGWNKDNFSSITHMSYYCIRWFQRTLFRMHGCFGWKCDGFHGRCLTCLMYCSCWMHWFMQTSEVTNLRCWMILCVECPSINVGT